MADNDPSSLPRAQPPLELAPPAAPAYSHFRVPSPGKRDHLDWPHPPVDALRERQTTDDGEYLPRLKRARLYQSEGGPFSGGDFGQPTRGLHPSEREPEGLSRQTSSGLLDDVVAQANTQMPGSGGLGLLGEGGDRQDLDMLGPGHEGRLELGLRGNERGWGPQRQFFDVLENSGERPDSLADHLTEHQRSDRNPDGW